MKKMRILIISQHFPPEKSGNAFRNGDMSKYLTKKGADVTVISPHPTFPFTNFPKKWKLFKKKTKESVTIINIFNWQPSEPTPSFVPRMAYYLIFPLMVSIWIPFNFLKYDVIISSSPPIFTGIPGFFSKLM